MSTDIGSSLGCERLPILQIGGSGVVGCGCGRDGIGVVNGEAGGTKMLMDRPAVHGQLLLSAKRSKLRDYAPGRDARVHVVKLGFQ